MKQTMGIARFRDHANGTSGYVAATEARRCIVVEPRLKIVGNPLLFPLVYIGCKWDQLLKKYDL